MSVFAEKYLLPENIGWMKFVPNVKVRILNFIINAKSLKEILRQQ